MMRFDHALEVVRTAFAGPLRDKRNVVCGRCRSRIGQPGVGVPRRDAERRPHDDHVSAAADQSADRFRRRAPGRVPCPQRERTARRRPASRQATAGLWRASACATDDASQPGSPPHRCCRRRDRACAGIRLRIVIRAPAGRTRAAQGVPQCRGRLPGEIVLAERHRRRVADRDRFARRRFDHERVMKRDRLEDRPQLVIAVARRRPSTRRSRLSFAWAFRVSRMLMRIVDRELWIDRGLMAISDRKINPQSTIHNPAIRNPQFIDVPERPRRAQLFEGDRGGVRRHVHRERGRRQFDVRLDLTHRQSRIDGRRRAGRVGGGSARAAVACPAGSSEFYRQPAGRSLRPVANDPSAAPMQRGLRRCRSPPIVRHRHAPLFTSIGRPRTSDEPRAQIGGRASSPVSASITAAGFASVEHAIVARKQQRGLVVRARQNEERCTERRDRLEPDRIRRAKPCVQSAAQPRLAHFARQANLERQRLKVAQ